MSLIAIDLNIRIYSLAMASSLLKEISYIEVLLIHLFPKKVILMFFIKCKQLADLAKLENNK